MYTIREKLFGCDKICINMETTCCPGARDSFIPLVVRYGEEFGLEPRSVYRYYEYKFYDDEFDICFIWNGLCTTYVFVPLPSSIPEVKRRLRIIITKLNKDIRENKLRMYDAIQ